MQTRTSSPSLEVRLLKQLLAESTERLDELQLYFTFTYMYFNFCSVSDSFGPQGASPL
jgi:hypothetical protein